ncbi:hypothetical protein BDB01DRAFT_763903 [Pilobolus umbonatus]|nr:hypothetical protein BDB01DRAFT_763903 [Pilobolus umbonatus]
MKLRAIISLILLLVTASVQAISRTINKFTASNVEFAQTSPNWLSEVHGPRQLLIGYPSDEDIQPRPLPTYKFSIDLKMYPEVAKQPSVDHPEIKRVLGLLDFSKVPQIKPRVMNQGVLDISQYNAKLDPDCWWSASICKKPKVSYIPEDIYSCPNGGDWGLNFDDGPHKAWWPKTEKDKEYDQPRFYNFLASQNKQKATLFFIGSNVVRFPEAAQRALTDGHTICSHTWSHSTMTTLTNEEVVAQLYWTQKAIKETLGITPKCWRPPYGDVDDRVRAIAWQMGMRTYLWDQDSYDWNMYISPGVGRLQPNVIDGYFEQWIKNRMSGGDSKRGHITLQHENSNVTVMMAEKWLPRLQTTFRLMPIHKCLNDPSPYWEESWVYPTLDNPNPPSHKNTFETPIPHDHKQPEESSALIQAICHPFTTHILFALFSYMLSN